MKRRETGGADTRAEYAAKLQGLVDRFAGMMSGQLARVQRGEAVVVEGWWIDFQPMFDDFCIEADGAVTPVTAVFVDPDASPRTTSNYRRPDGSLVHPDRRGGEE